LIHTIDGANKNPGHSEENNDVTQLSDTSPLALGVLEKLS